MATAGKDVPIEGMKVKQLRELLRNMSVSAPPNARKAALVQLALAKHAKPGTADTPTPASEGDAAPTVVSYPALAQIRLALVD